MEALALERQYAAAVELTAAKRDLHFLRGLAHTMEAQRAFFEAGHKICETMNNKTTELEGVLAALEARHLGRGCREGTVLRRSGEAVFLELRGGVLRQMKVGKDYAPDTEIAMMTASVRLPRSAQEEDWRDHYRLEINVAASSKPTVFYTCTERDRAAWAKALQDSIALELNTVAIGKGAPSSGAPSTGSGCASSCSSPGALADTSLPGSPLLTQSEHGSGSTSGLGGSGSGSGLGIGSPLLPHRMGAMASASSTTASAPAPAPTVGVALTPEYIRAIQGCCGNDVCAECGAREPDWAVINFGILICVECSGVHRSLGTHISRVRSLTLDRWTPEAVLLLTQLGNAHHNAVYEAALPPGAKPPPQAPRAARDEFIRAKYERHAFVAPLVEPVQPAQAQVQQPAQSTETTTTTPTTTHNLEEQFCSACRMGGVEGARAVVRLLAHGCRAGAEHTGADSARPTVLAVRAGNVLALEVLLQNGAHATETDARGWTPVHHAALHNRPRCLARLLQGVRLDDVPPAPDGVRPRDVAAWSRAAEALNVLCGRRNAGAVDLTVAAVLAPGDWADDHFTPALHSTVPPPGTIGPDGTTLAHKSQSKKKKKKRDDSRKTHKHRSDTSAAATPATETKETPATPTITTPTEDLDDLSAYTTAEVPAIEGDIRSAPHHHLHHGASTPSEGSPIVGLRSSGDAQSSPLLPGSDAPQPPPLPTSGPPIALAGGAGRRPPPPRTTIHRRATVGTAPASPLAVTHSEHPDTST